MKHLKIIIALTIILLFITACSESAKFHIPQEGEIVTLRQNQQLIIKAKLGARREHIPDRFDNEFYPRETEHYVGQFPINYVPERFAKISEQEALALPKPMVLQQLEFNLMLNGSTVQATDASPLEPKGIEHPDQVKVFVQNFKPSLQTQDSTYNSKKYFDLDIKELANLNSGYQIHGLQCYIRKTTEDPSPICFGSSKYHLVSGVKLYLPVNINDLPLGNQHRLVWATSNEPIYGGITIDWYTDVKNINRWQEIDAAIWRLLEAWNVSPLNDVDKQQ